jgi:uncharacterized membrane protein (DUF4010 family)
LSSGSTSAPGGSDLDRWIALRHDALRIAGIAIAVIILFIIGINLLSVLLVAGVLALYLWAISAATRRTSDDEQEPGDVETPAAMRK